MLATPRATLEVMDEGSSQEQVTRPGYQERLRSLAAATWAGVLVGVLIGGLGGRLAMRLVAMANPGPSARGLVTDDGFIVGRITVPGTLGFLAFSLYVGVLGALVYLFVRRWLIGPSAFRVACCSAGAGLVIGSQIIHSDGVDFHRLQPVWLTVGLFVLIPAAFGLLIGPAVEQFDRQDGWFHSAPLRYVLSHLVLWIFSLFFIGVVLPLSVAILLWEALRRVKPIARIAHSETAAWVIRGGFVSVALLAGYGLLRDVAALI